MPYYCGLLSGGNTLSSMQSPVAWGALEHKFWMKLGRVDCISHSRSAVSPHVGWECSSCGSICCQVLTPTPFFATKQTSDSPVCDGIHAHGGLHARLEVAIGSLPEFVSLFTYGGHGVM